MSRARVSRPLPKPGEVTLLRVAEVAKILGLSESGAYRQLDLGRIPGKVKQGRRVYVSSSPFWRWLDQGGAV